MNPVSNLALNRPAVASTTEGEAWAASNAVDASATTRWASNAADPQWIMVDLGANYSFNQIVLQWETAYGKHYAIQTSTNGMSWTTIYETTSSIGGKETLAVNGTGRYVRMYGTARGTGYGYSLFDFQVNNNAVAASSSVAAISSSKNSSKSSSGSVVSSSVASSIKSSVASSSADLALNRPVVASTSEGAGTAAHFAVDGNTNTRWSSQFSDGQWIYVDLGSTTRVNGVTLKWEGAYAKAYSVQISNDAISWITVKVETNSDGVFDDHPLVASGRYLRILSVTRATGYGISLWDFEVY